MVSISNTYNPQQITLDNYPFWILDRIYSGSTSQEIVSNLTAILQTAISDSIDKPVASISLPAIAVLLQRDDLLEQLLKAGCDIDRQDSQGYTAAHFAALLGRTSSLKIAKEAGADFNKQTNKGATVYDFSRYRTQSHYTAEALLCLWHEEHRIETSPLNTELLYAFNCQPPVLVRTIEDCQSPIRGQYEAIAIRTVAAGEGIIEYTGQVLQRSQQKEASDYQMRLSDQVCIDAKDHGNESRFINHGPPNCTCKTVFYKGIPRIVVTALRTIVKGEPLLMNYGFGYFYNRQMFELNPLFLDQWISNVTLGKKTIEAAFEDTSLNGEERREVYNYLYEFPHYFVQRIKQGVLTKKKVLEFEAAMKSLPPMVGLNFPRYIHDAIVKRIEALN
ncbi:MAG: SET domain-containing protein-lysine N-methyltransferase [Verrucomicrobia bacterium]|nr:SET domain-containing protein-lysine N-methyltransferase [Verrucomicrobiota bacterium]MBS0636977.1 SET domain-containing protein-lysine N-methyltransferase [Verrucomicrobiota bacterium]